MSGNIGYYQEMHMTFVAALATEGFDYHEVDMLLQKPSPDPLSWKNAARKLSVAEVTVLVTYGAPATLVVISATKGSRSHSAVSAIRTQWASRPERRRHQLQGADDELADIF